MTTGTVEPVPDLMYDVSDRQRLADLFAPCFMLIQQLRVAGDYGDPTVLRERTKDLLDRVEREARQAGVAGEDIRNAQFAVVAFLDEAILSSDWPQRDYWMAKPLQLELYDRYDAGEAFFTRLDELMKQPALHADVLEVYYLCLALGFKGQYMLHNQGHLRTLIDQALAALERTPGFKARTLSPHGKPRGRVAQEIRRTVPTWVILVTAAVIGLVVYLGMYMYMARATDAAAQEVDEITQTQSR